MIYETISRWCRKKNISIKQLERKAGLKNGAIGKWKTCSPTLKNLEKVASTLGISVTTLILEAKKEMIEESEQ